MMADTGGTRSAFERIGERFAEQPGVTTGTGFGSNPGLRFEGRIFAMLSNDRLVVKLPAGRVGELVDGGLADRFDAGKGRPMREWAIVTAGHLERWDELVDEAFAFVAGR